jgi:hypothetical protein
LIASVLLACPLYALVGEARAAGGATDRRLSAKRWIDRQDELARDLRSGAVTPLAWHDEVNRLARAVDVAQLVAQASRSRPVGALLALRPRLTLDCPVAAGGVAGVAYPA